MARSGTSRSSGGRGGARGAQIQPNKKRAAEDENTGTGLSLKLKIPRPNSKTQNDPEAGDGNEDLDEAAASAKEEVYVIKIICFMPGDPNGKTQIDRRPARVKGDRIVKIDSAETVSGFVQKVSEKAIKSIGGYPSIWDLTLLVDGPNAEVFRDAVKLDLEDADENDTAELWAMYLEELSTSGSGQVHVTRQAESVPENASGKKKEKDTTPNRQDPNAVVASAAGKTVTSGHMEKDRQLTSRYLCESPACPNKKDGIHWCWHPYWAPQQHLPLTITVRTIWTRAWENGVESVDINRPPKVPPFLQPGSQAQLAQATDNAPVAVPKKEEAHIANDDDWVEMPPGHWEDDEIQFIQHVISEKIPNPVQKESDEIKKERARSQQAGDRKVLNSIGNFVKSEGEAQAPVDVIPRYGPYMLLPAWCEEYDISPELAVKLAVFGATIPHAVAEMTDVEMKEAAMSPGERLMLRTAVMRWRCTKVDARQSYVKKEHSEPGPSIPRRSMPAQSQPLLDHRPIQPQLHHPQYQPLQNQLPPRLPDHNWFPHNLPPLPSLQPAAQGLPPQLPQMRVDQAQDQAQAEEQEQDHDQDQDQDEIHQPEDRN